MTGPFRHIGGAVIADHGPIPLAAARDLARFYAIEAQAAAASSSGFADLCQTRATVLDAAVRDAARWRRAAGWRDPDEAD